MADVNIVDKAETHLRENRKSGNIVAEEILGYNDEML